MNQPTRNRTDADTDLMDNRFDADPKILAGLHARLADSAASEGILDIAYRTVDTPVGSLLLAATDQGLVRVAYPGQGHDTVLGDLAKRISSRILHVPGRLDPVARELDEYFTGRRRAFDLRLDLHLATAFRRRVLAELTAIGYGRTASYGDIAESVGNPRAVRAVGTACATNPLPLVVPCHRVVHANGSPGGYAGGAKAKARLLELEARYSDSPR